MNTAINILNISEAHIKKVAKLTTTSHSKPMDFSTVLPWDEGVDLNMYPKKKEHSWIYGTAYFTDLSDKEKLELSWLEIGRDISMFIWLEQTIPVLYMGYINKYQNKISETISDYLMVFSKEEIVHTMMFKKFMSLADLNMWQPPKGLYELLTDTLPKMKPEVGILFTLLIEWVAELGAIYSTQVDGVEPMTKEMFRAHHVDEARHIAFGRWISEAYFDSAPEEELEQIRVMAKQIIPKLVDMFTYNPEIALHTSFDFPIAQDNNIAIEKIWRSDANSHINQKRFSVFYAWTDKLGLI